MPTTHSWNGIIMGTGANHWNNPVFRQEKTPLVFSDSITVHRNWVKINDLLKEILCQTVCSEVSSHSKQVLDSENQKKAMARLVKVTVCSIHLWTNQKSHWQVWSLQTMSFGSKLSSYNTTTVKSFLKIKKYQLVWLNIYEYFMALCQFVRKKKHTHTKSGHVVGHNQTKIPCWLSKLLFKWLIT